MNDPLIQKLCDHWQENFPEEAIKKAVRSTFPNLSEAKQAIDIKRFAAERGVVEIRSASIQADGIISLLEGSDKYLIEVNKHHPENRKRFTIAHEIGHTFFFELDDEINSRKRHRIEDTDLTHTNKYEEYLCNAAAAEILMPSTAFSSQFRVTGPSTKTVITLSRLFKTSLWATSRRLIELHPFPKFIVALWEYQPNCNCYQTSWIAQPSKNRNQKKWIVDKSAPIFSTFHSRSSFKGRRLVSLGGNIDDYFVDVSIIKATEPRIILTVFILDHRAVNLFEGKENSSPELEAGQMPLFT